jgi:hypothetical protein
MTETEFDIREGWMPMPALVTVAGAAAPLGINRQAALKINAGTLPATRHGRDYVIQRDAVEAAARREGEAGDLDPAAADGAAPAMTTHRHRQARRRHSTPAQV